MKTFSIGYKDQYGDFSKVWERGSTRKFETIEDCKTYMNENKDWYLENGITSYKIMQGWNVIEICEVK